MELNRRVAAHGMAVALLAVTPAVSARSTTPCRTGAAVATVFDQFDHLDRQRWRIVEENWGGQRDGEDYNGGVIPENVSVSDGKLRLAARGNFYNGVLRGVGRDGRRLASGRRTGAAIETTTIYAGGSFEMRAKIIGRLGVVSAMWTYAYREEGGVIRNHEIDIEFPGVANEGGKPTFDHAMLVSWTGLAPGEKTAAYHKLPATIADGAFHRFRFDWTPPGGDVPGSVMFYIDETLAFETARNVPSLPAPLRIGVWFPQEWAGEPNFVEDVMEVDWICVTPLAGSR